jgi:hypothetical protein
MTTPKQSDLVKYYFKYKELVLLHRELGFGKAPRSSEGFTESICCNLFGHIRATEVQRKYDLRDPSSGSKIEVKATTETDGSTTINPNSVFDYLYWVVFLLDQDTITIKKIEYAEFENFRSTCGSQKRANITLKNFKCTDMGIFLFSKENQTLISQTLQDQILHIKKSAS